MTLIVPHFYCEGSRSPTEDASFASHSPTEASPSPTEASRYLTEDSLFPTEDASFAQRYLIIQKSVIHSDRDMVVGDRKIDIYCLDPYR